ncbi:Putative sterile alpha motif domain, High mobility group box domain-containing protein [Colletotrichum destructivum]|uniref:Sterile alpha motif domain, High mobility group box domain-containing protein n=1 Tax=Colletotrichum destructivum TaxID=34406 RepID=A0AAX4I453_9PEZI|nr:Putative sterile alpha motif domain, High mobility group box domain-containing protein [Colletotrichum destructivum]
MAHELEGIFAELGISQYLGIFLEQGFDTWETILDITESDLDALGVKLGHRRKLQRRIANSRGLAPDASLVSPTRATAEEPKPEAQRPEQPRPEVKDGPVVTKRKYRRHPKPDENAPERPPSAYVLFSNKMRDDLKGRNLTFTEIAKLVGEHWQNLTPGEKEPYESSALKAKEKYNHDLAEYKKTAEYRKYNLYLQDFKARQASANQAKESSKRQKLDVGARLQNGSASVTPGSLSSTGSGSESHQGSEPPPNRKQRVGSVVSVSESQYSTAVPTPISHHHVTDDAVHSPTSIQFDRESLHSASPRASQSRSRRPTWTENQLMPEVVGPTTHLPSLSDVFSNGRGGMNGVSRSPEANGFGSFAPPQHPGTSIPPPLKHEYSSTGSSASSGSYPRTPSESSLPIHALLSNKPPLASPYELQSSPFTAAPLPLQDQKPIFTGQLQGPHGPMNGIPNHSSHSFPQGLMRFQGYHSPPPALLRFQSSSSSGTDGSMASSHASSHASSQISLGVGERSDPKLDGMSALVRAGEIVNRRVQ